MLPMLQIQKVSAARCHTRSSSASQCRLPITCTYQWQLYEGAPVCVTIHTMSVSVRYIISCRRWCVCLTVHLLPSFFFDKYPTVWAANKHFVSLFAKSVYDAVQYSQVLDGRYCVHEKFFVSHRRSRNWIGAMASHNPSGVCMACDILNGSGWEIGHDCVYILYIY